MRWVVLLLTVLGTIYFIYMASFYAWLSATPVQQPELAKLFAERYFLGSLAWLIGGGCLFAYLGRKRIRAKGKARELGKHDN
jgi:hypothetical protein